MRISRSAGVIAGVLSTLFLLGCGDVYRPVVIPFPTPGGDPQIQSLVMVANQGVVANPAVLTDVRSCLPTDSCPGSISTIDVPGDANMGNQVIGENPWSATLVGSLVYTANRGNNTVSTYSPFITGINVTEISMPLTVTAHVDATTTRSVTVAPVNFIGADRSAGAQIFATMPACATVSNGICTAVDPASPGVVAAISGASFLDASLVGNNPTALVELPDASRVYVVNQGSNSVSVLGVNDHVQQATITGFSIPTFALASPDSKFVFVLNRGNGTIGVIDTATNTVTFSPSFSATPSAVLDLPLNNPMFYDSKRQRLWVTSPADDSVVAFDVSSLGATAPTMNQAGAVHQCTAGAATGTCLPVGSGPFSVTALSDGTRAYVANGGSSGVAPSVTMIDANSFTATTVNGYIGTSPRGIASSSDATKVYIVNHDPTTAPSPDPSAPAGSTIIVQQPGTNVIKTSNNSFLQTSLGTPVNIIAPFQDPVNCSIDTPEPWLPGHSYQANSAVVPRTPNGHAYRSTVAGASGASDPTFCTTSGCTFNDGTVTWLEIGAPLNCPRQRPNVVLAE